MFRSFVDVIKDEPGTTGVHVSTALGNELPPRRRYKPFISTIGALNSGAPKKPAAKIPSTSGPTPVMTAGSTAKAIDAGSTARLFHELMGSRFVTFGDALKARTSFLGVTPPASATAKRYATVADLPAAVHTGLKGKPKRLRQWMHVFNSTYDAHSDLPAKEREARAFAGAWATVQKNLAPPMTGEKGRVLHPLNDHAYHVPFAYDPNFMGSLTHEETPRFLGAITHPEDLPKAKVPLASLRAIQNRVNSPDVERHVANPSKKRPVIVQSRGNHYIADGHDRLTARWLRGKNNAKVRLFDMDAADTSPQNMKKQAGWEIPFEIRKADPDQHLIFGWASVVTKAGEPIIDHQGDIIPVDELEKAFYSYVLNSRDQGHMHSKIGVGRLVECVVFSKQKQDVLKIAIRDEDGDQIEGAWVGFFVDDPDVWKAHKRGELPEFSIGGSAVPVDI